MNKIFENKIYKIVMGIIKAFLIIVLISYITIIAIQRFSGNKSLMGYRFFTVATGSMKGVYDIGDVIAVEDYDFHKLKVGDDVAYLGNRGGLEGKIITHRIIEIEESNDGELIFKTKGTAAQNVDPSIRGGQILGKVSFVVPIITPINHLLRSKIGFFFIIFCPLVVTIVLEILQTITDYQLEKRELQEKEK